MALPNSCKIVMSVLAVILSIIASWLYEETYNTSRIESLVAVFIISFLLLYATLLFLREKVAE